jgi:hypothetical protein
MTLRLIVRTDDAAMASNVGGAVLSEYTTFDIEAPEVESFLRVSQGTYGHRQIIGIEIVGEGPSHSPNHSPA